jgi:signal transduction histidine kinase
VARRWGTSRASASASAGPAAPRPPGTAEPWPGWRSGWLARLSTSATVALLAIVVVVVGLQLPGRPPPVLAGAAAALVVGAGALGWLLIRQPAAGTPVLAALAVAGLGGAVLGGLVPGGAGMVIVDLAVAGLGLRVPLRPALGAGAAVLAAGNLGLLLGGGTSLLSLPAQDIGAGFLFALGAFARSALIAHDQARVAQSRAEDLLVQLRASQAARAEAAALGERARVAREIHDILAHALSGLVLTLDTMELLGRQDSPDPGAMTRMLEQVSRAQRIARDGLADTRRAIAALRGDELPGPARLDRLVRETAAATGLRAALTVTGRQRPLPPEVGLALYRTAQEALINAAKYAGRAGRAELHLRYRDEDVELAVDDARSDDAAPPGPAGLTFGGYGLTGMRERAELLGGQLAAGPTDSGFRVLLQLPLPPEPGAGRPA